MRLVKQRLQETLNGPNRYTIPLFQRRHYSWLKPNWEKLWDDLTELREAESDGRSHFMGSLVFVPEKRVTDRLPAFQVIDGQQRLTTLSLLLCALRDQALQRGDSQLADEITEDYLVHKRRVNDEYFRVYPRNRDRPHYEMVIRNTGQPSGGIADASPFLPRNSRARRKHKRPTASRRCLTCWWRGWSSCT